MHAPCILNVWLGMGSGLFIPWTGYRRRWLDHWHSQQRKRGNDYNQLSTLLSRLESRPVDRTTRRHLPPLKCEFLGQRLHSVSTAHSRLICLNKTAKKGDQVQPLCQVCGRSLSREGRPWPCASSTTPGLANWGFTIQLWSLVPLGKAPETLSAFNLGKMPLPSPES